MSESSSSKWIMVGAVIGLLIGAGIVYVAVPKPDVSIYEDQIDGLESQVTDLQGQLTELQEDVRALDELESQVTDLQGQLTELQEDVRVRDELESQVTDLQGQLTELQEDYAEALYRARARSTPTQLTSERSFGSCSPSISGDGSKIAFRYIQEGGSYEIWVINSDGSGLIGPLATGLEPCISGDGSKIAFTREGKIWVINSDGSGLSGPLATGSTPSINYDGSKIAFESGSYGDTQIFVVNSDGARARAAGLDIEFW